MILVFDAGLSEEHPIFIIVIGGLRGTLIPIDGKVKTTNYANNFESFFVFSII
jgi:hypothetical protein